MNPNAFIIIILIIISVLCSHLPFELLSPSVIGAAENRFFANHPTITVYRIDESFKSQDMHILCMMSERNAYIDVSEHLISDRPSNSPTNNCNGSNEQIHA
jgi:hypothetical protein